MSPSSDIETLFGHFGGNASGYQEIGRENEASTARTRWPLLVTLDLKQTPIPAIVQQRERAAFLQATADATEAPHGEHGVATEPTASAAEADATSTTALRSKAPLFTRAHRRNVPPVESVVKTDSPRGGDRFGAVPEVPGTVAVAPEGQSAAAPVSAVPAVAPAVPPMVPPAIPPVVQGLAMQSRVPPVTPPAAQPALQPAVPPVMQPAHQMAQSAQPAAFTAPVPGAARSFMQAGSPAAVQPVLSRPAAFAAPQARTFATGAVPPAVPVAPVAPTSPFARTAAATQPAPILGRLFASAAPQAVPAAPPQAFAAQPADLRSVFDRLRGAPRNTAAPAPAPHSWLTNGPRRS
jgi:hypothetical protein